MNAPAPFRVLMVCTANICRSPMAEHLLWQAWAPDAPVGLQVASAGVRGFDGAPMDPPAAQQLRRLGGDPIEFRSRPLTDAQCEHADLILTATRRHRSQVLERMPRMLRRTFTLLEFAAALPLALPEQPTEVLDPVSRVAMAARIRSSVPVIGEAQDIGDPYGGPPELHEHTAALIQEATRSIADSLLGQHSG